MEKTAGPMGETVSLDDYRSYAPGMCLGRYFNSGPNVKHEPWKIEVSSIFCRKISKPYMIRSKSCINDIALQVEWLAFLRLITEVFMVICGIQSEYVAGASASKR